MSADEAAAAVAAAVVEGVAAADEEEEPVGSADDGGAAGEASRGDVVVGEAVAGALLSSPTPEPASAVTAAGAATRNQHGDGR